VRRLAVVAALALGAAGCGSTVPGQPAASGVTSGGGPMLPTELTAPSSGLQLTDQPCSLLSSSDLQQLNASSPPSTTMSGPDQACQVLTSSGAVEVAVVKGQGLAQATFSGPTTPVTIGQHQGVKYPTPNDSAGCIVAFAVTGSSRVDIVTEQDDDNPADPCAFTMQIARLVEPHLPTG
jgi:hypothetical protein